MGKWYVDEGLQKLIDEWKRVYPQAVVYTIGDSSHQSHTSEHNPEFAGKAPGADDWEVDAADFMPSVGPTMTDLRELANELVENRDPRFLYCIIDQKICSSVVSPWIWRTYNGKKHTHLHLSVNDKYDANRADWKWEDEVAREYTYAEVPGKFPLLRIGDEDKPGKVQHIQRIQGVLISVYGRDLGADGVYGKNTAEGIKFAMRTDDNRSSTNGTKFEVPEIKRIFGIW